MPPEFASRRNVASLFSSVRHAAVVAVLVLGCPLLPAAASKDSPPGPLIKVAEYHLQHARQGAAAAALGDYVYVFGGYQGGALGYIERLDVNTGKVETLTGNALARRYHAVVEQAGRFYLFGGRGHTLDGDYEATVEIFDPQTRSLTHSEAMPRPGSNMAVAVLDNKAYFFGGERRYKSRSLVTNYGDVFDLASRTWAVGAECPAPCEGAAIAVDSFVLLFGGFDGDNAVDSVLAYSPGDKTWRQLPPLARPASAHSVARLGNYAFLFGDYRNLNQVLAYDLSTLKTIECQPGFKGVRHSAAVAHRDRIYVIGGNVRTETGDESDLIQVFALNPNFTAK